MAKIDKEIIKNLTTLCRIDCTEDEQQTLFEDLEKILKYVDQLEEVDTSNVEPSYHVLEGIHNVMREDIVETSMPRQVFLDLSPSHTGGMIKVPQVINK